MLFPVIHIGSPFGISLQANTRFPYRFYQRTRLKVKLWSVPCVEWTTQNPFFVSRRLQNANGVLSRSANQMRVILALGQSGISNFALVRKKTTKNALCLNQSAFSNFALYVKHYNNYVTRPHKLYEILPPPCFNKTYCCCCWVASLTINVHFFGYTNFKNS